MKALLDINVLISLLDADHIYHQSAWDWFEENIESGWATCPLTENGCLRIMSKTGYPNHFTTAEIADHLRTATDTDYHEFWPDSISILNKVTINWRNIISPKQLTDLYLLALAVENKGRFVTFDKKITASLVSNAGSEHYKII